MKAVFRSVLPLFGVSACAASTVLSYADSARAVQPSEPDSVPVAEMPRAVSGPSEDGGVRAQRDEAKRGLLGPVRLGPLVGSGLPNLINFGVTAKMARHFGAGLNIGLIPTLPIQYYGDATVSYREYDLYGRVYPFATGFFVGSGIGFETASATYNSSVEDSGYARQAARLGLPASLDYQGEASVRSLIVIPQVGYLHVFDSGFAAGLDLGVQIPLTSSTVEFSRQTSAELPATIVDRYLAPNEQSVSDTLQRIGRTPIPAFAVHVGWLL